MRPSPLLLERFTRHALAERACGSVADAVTVSTAIQAQDVAAARLGVRARCGDTTDTAVTRAIEDDRTIVRTWLMRSTIHLVHADDARWLVRLIGPTVSQRYRTRWQQMGLSDAVLERCLSLLPGVLADGPRTRADIRAAFEADGVATAFGEAQAPTHVLVHASTVGLVCRATDRGRDATFALLDEWLPGSPAGPSGDDALAELARRYFAAYSPATAADFACWSGLPSGRAISLIRDELTPVDVDGRAGYRLATVEVARGVRLLPAFDNYVLGYADRSAMLPAELHDRVYQGGMIRPTLVVDGAIAGTWALHRASGRVTVSPFDAPGKRVLREIEREAADVARFVGRPLRLSVET